MPKAVLESIGMAVHVASLRGERRIPGHRITSASMTSVLGQHSAAYARIQDEQITEVGNRCCKATVSSPAPLRVCQPPGRSIHIDDATLGVSSRRSREKVECNASAVRWPD